METINKQQVKDTEIQITKYRDALFRAMHDCRLVDVKLILDSLVTYYVSLDDSENGSAIISILKKECRDMDHLFNELTDIYNEDCDKYIKESIDN